MDAVQLKGIHKRFGDTEVIAGVDLSVHEGEFLVFVGPSGCGKSTLLRLIAGLEEPTSGDLFIGGRSMRGVDPADRGVAMVFQTYALYPHMTVADNMAFALRVARVGRAEREARVREVAAMLRLEALLDRMPRELSGGQRQRVAIGRALVRRPSVFLFDEPLSNLDAELRLEMRIELARLHERLGTTMIYVTHDQVEAMTLGDRVALFNRGRIVQIGPPMALYQQPLNRFVAGFLGSPRVNLLDRPAASAPEPVRRLWAQMTEGAPAGVAAVGLRPEHLSLSTAGEGVNATVVMSERLGDSTTVHVQVAGLEDLIRVRVGGDEAHLPQATVTLRPSVAHRLCFNLAGDRLDATA